MLWAKFCLDKRRYSSCIGLPFFCLVILHGSMYRTTFSANSYVLPLYLRYGADIQTIMLRWKLIGICSEIGARPFMLVVVCINFNPSPISRHEDLAEVIMSSLFKRLQTVW